MLFSLSCDDNSKKEEKENENIVNPPTRVSTVTLLDSQNPDGKGGYFSFGGKDFINGYYDQDLMVPLPAQGITSGAEESGALANKIFISIPGFLWKIDPPSPVTITLSARGKSQTIRRDVPTEGLLAVSLLSFPNVFPPVFRERYELVIASFPGVPQPFSYRYSFNIRRLDAQSIFAKVDRGDGVDRFRLGQDNANFLMARITPSEKCDGCVIEVESPRAILNIKYFSETPVIPQPGNLRISFPRRFAGVLIRNEAKDIAPTVSGNNTDSVSVFVSVPASFTSISPLCTGSNSFVCPVRRQGMNVPSYYRFLNAIPFDAAEKSLGGIQGIASASLTLSGKLTIKRDGLVMEKKDFEIDSGTIQSLNSPLLPTWVLDDLRSALFSGAPEFRLE